MSALVMANAMELAGMTVISVTHADEQFIVFARYLTKEQLDEADRIWGEELNSLSGT